jgi:hypothetical protein
MIFQKTEKRDNPITQEDRNIYYKMPHSHFSRLSSLTFFPPWRNDFELQHELITLEQGVGCRVKLRPNKTEAKLLQKG